MELRKVSRLKDLKQERNRLQRETSAAKNLLSSQLGIKNNRVDRKLPEGITVSSLLKTVALLGVTQVVGSKIKPVGFAASMAATGGNPLMLGLQQGFKAITRGHGKRKWLALIPIALGMLRQWRKHTKQRRSSTTYPPTSASAIS